MLQRRLYVASAALALSYTSYTFSIRTDSVVLLLLACPPLGIALYLLFAIVKDYFKDHNT